MCGILDQVPGSFWDVTWGRLLGNLQEDDPQEVLAHNSPSEGLFYAAITLPKVGYSWGAAKCSENQLSVGVGAEAESWPTYTVIEKTRFKYKQMLLHYY